MAAKRRGKRGRPFVPKSLKKSDVLQIRVSEGDRKKLEEKARLAGKGLPEWVRERILGE